MAHEDSRYQNLRFLEGAPTLRASLRRQREALRLTCYELLDRLAVALDGGLRVRVLRTRSLVGSQLSARAYGCVLGPPLDRILSEVLALGPEGPGTLHLRHDGKGTWSLWAAGQLADPVFQQRLRNVLVNS